MTPNPLLSSLRWIAFIPAACAAWVLVRIVCGFTLGSLDFTRTYDSIRDNAGFRGLTWLVGPPVIAGMSMLAGYASMAVGVSIAPSHRRGAAFTIAGLMLAAGLVVVALALIVPVPDGQNRAGMVFKHLVEAGAGCAIAFRCAVKSFPRSRPESDTGGDTGGDTAVLAACAVVFSILARVWPVGFLIWGFCFSSLRWWGIFLILAVGSVAIELLAFGLPMVIALAWSGQLPASDIKRQGRGTRTKAAG